MLDRRLRAVLCVLCRLAGGAGWKWRRRRWPTAGACPRQAPPLPKAGPLAQPRSPDQVGFPGRITKSVIPPGSPLTPAVVSLGEKLFFEAGSRATARLPARHAMIRRAPSPTAGRSRSASADAPGQRNAPTILNALYNKTQFWDGRVDTLEQQAALPITNPFEMGCGQRRRRCRQDRRRRRLPAAIHASLWSRRERAGHVDAPSPPTSGHSFRSIPRSIISSPETKCDQRCGQARLGIFQHQSPLQLVPRFDRQSARM